MGKSVWRFGKRRANFGPNSDQKGKKKNDFFLDIGGEKPYIRGVERRRGN